MNCPKCGNENIDVAKFCIKCGYQLKKPGLSDTPIQMRKTSSNVSSQNVLKGTQEYICSLYSKTAIYGYSLLLSILAGGILMALNIRNVKGKKDFAIILGFSIFFFLVEILVLYMQNDLFAISWASSIVKSSFLEIPSDGKPHLSPVGLIYNLAGAVLLAHPLWGYYLGDIKYKKKSYVFVTGLIISFTVVVLSFLSIFLFERQPIRADLATYKAEISKVIPFEKDAIESLKSLLTSENLDDQTFLSRLNDEVIPKYADRKAKYTGIKPKTKKVQEIHSQLNRMLDLQMDALLKLQKGLTNKDERLVSEARNEMDELRNLHSTWQSALKELVKEYYGESQ